MRKALKRLKEEAQQGRADVIIGKHGISSGVLEEIRRRLEDKGVVKVKALKTALKVTGLDRKALAKETAKRLGAWLLDIRGRTFVLYLPPEKRRKKTSRRDNIRPQRLSGVTGRRKPWLRR